MSILLLSWVLLLLSFVFLTQCTMALIWNFIYDICHLFIRLCSMCHSLVYDLWISNDNRAHYATLKPSPSWYSPSPPSPKTWLYQPPSIWTRNSDLYIGDRRMGQCRVGG
jgi:hypothetical protein